MALNKILVNDNGIQTTYHRITHVSLNDNQVSCCVESYVSPEYRISNKPADASYYYFTISVEEEESMGIRALCYTKLKEMDEWVLSTDC